MTRSAAWAEVTPPSLAEMTLQPVPLDVSGRVVLLATDGSPAATGATRVAHALAARHHAVVHAVRVVDASPALIPPPLDLALAMSDRDTGTCCVSERRTGFATSSQRRPGSNVSGQCA